jgi:hypothetical protein
VLHAFHKTLGDDFIVPGFPIDVLKLVEGYLVYIGSLAVQEVYDSGQLPEVSLAGG